MTVGALIKHLEKFDKEQVVRLHEKEGEPVLFVLKEENKEGVWLQSESDCNIPEEIKARIADAVQDNQSEADVYAEMLEDGIDVELVRKYMGANMANHMKKCCEEHGLI